MMPLSEKTFGKRYKSGKSRRQSGKKNGGPEAAVEAIKVYKA
jgi:hypothetical protein